MSTAEGGSQREEGEYGRAAKRLKTEEREEGEEEGEEELEEGEDSDSGSLPGNGEPAGDTRARWSESQYDAGRKVRTGTDCVPPPPPRTPCGDRVLVSQGTARSPRRHLAVRKAHRCRVDNTLPSGTRDAI